MNTTSEFQLKATVHWEMQTEFLWQPCSSLKLLAGAFRGWSNVCDCQIHQHICVTVYILYVFCSIMLKIVSIKFHYIKKSNLYCYYGYVLLNITKHENMRFSSFV